MNLASGYRNWQENEKINKMRITFFEDREMIKLCQGINFHGLVEVLIYFAIFFTLALLLTFIHLKITDIKLRKQMKNRSEDKNKVNKIFKIIEKKRKKDQERIAKEKEEIRQKLKL
jgi:hypothetical protein